jgi:tRNA(adenine34) deaminase
VKKQREVIFKEQRTSMQTGLATEWGGSDALMMGRALALARQAAALGEVPVGALVVDSSGAIVAEAGNSCIAAADPSGHAEMVAIRAAARKIGNYRLPGMTVYVTLEPCPMCAALLVHARIARLVFGATDSKGGGVVSKYGIGTDQRLNHTFAVTGGVLAEECSALLRDFFQNRR